MSFISQRQSHSHINKLKMDEIKHQMSIHRQNLLCVCRLAIKSLIGQSQYQAIEDSCPEFRNFATIMEHILNHRLKGQISWFGLEEPRDVWHFIRATCGSAHHTCINNIVQMEAVRSPKAKGRAWLRIALMEKKLGDHLATALRNDKALRAFYGEGAFLRSEEAVMFVKSLQALHSLDFSCCIKGEKLETGVASVIDYAQYLRFQISDEGYQEALREDQQLFAASNQPREGDPPSSGTLAQLQGNYRVVCAQKNYIEEIASQKDQQLVESKRKSQALERMVLGLQEQVACLKEAQLMSRRELEEHLIAGHWQDGERVPATQPERSDIAMDKFSGLPSPVDRSSLQGFDSVSLQRSVSPISSCSGISAMEASGDQRSVPYSYPRFARKEKEDTPSLVALAGSFTSQISAISIRSTETNSSGVSENQPASLVTRTLSPDCLSAISVASTSEGSPMLTSA